MKNLHLIAFVIISSIKLNSKAFDPNCQTLNDLVIIKNKVAQSYWKDFNRKTLFSPIVYFTKTGLYLINGNKKLKERVKSIPVNCIPSTLSINFSKTIDTTSFHMNVSYHDTDTSVLYYQNTLGMISDYFLTKKFIPDVQDNKDWVSMVIHEMFHQYQRDFPRFRKNQLESKKSINRDTLNYYFQKKEWFQKSIIKENKLLLEILDLNNNDSIRNNISNYLLTKRERFSRMKLVCKLDISSLENSLSKSEGTARYIEYCVKLLFKQVNHTKELPQIRETYKTHQFKNYSLLNDKWMYEVNSSYYYAIGFNLTRVLEKLKINYQRDIFAKDKPFDTYLIEYINR